MAIDRRKLREIALQVLFSSEFNDLSEDEIISFFMHLLMVSKKNVKEAIARANLVREKLDIIDQKIGKFSIDYSVERIQKVELSILRLALFEAMFDPLVPHKVAISEAIRLSRKFATREGGSYINAILDAILKNHELTI